MAGFSSARTRDIDMQVAGRVRTVALAQTNPDWFRTTLPGPYHRVMLSGKANYKNFGYHTCDRS